MLFFVFFLLVIVLLSSLTNKVEYTSLSRGRERVRNKRKEEGRVKKRGEEGKGTGLLTHRSFQKSSPMTDSAEM